MEVRGSSSWRSVGNTENLMGKKNGVSRKLGDINPKPEVEKNKTCLKENELPDRNVYRRE